MSATDTAGLSKQGYDPVALADSLASAADKSAKLLGDYLARQHDVGPVARRRRIRLDQGVHGNGGEDAVQSLSSGRDADEPVVGLFGAVAVVDAQVDGPVVGTGRRAGERRPALSPRRLGGAFPVRLRQAVLPDRCALAAQRRRKRRGTRRAHAEKSRFLHSSVHRRAGAVELRADQSGSISRNHRQRRPEPGQGPEQPARRHRARQRSAQDIDDRQQGVRARRKHRDDAGQGRLPERADAADPVRADDGQGLQAAAADHTAVDQQVLHPRFAREELAGQMVRRARAHRLRDLVGQPRQEACRQGLRRLHAGRRARGARRDRAGDRRARDQCTRLLPGRNPAHRHIGLHGGEKGPAHRQRWLHELADRFHRVPASSRCSSTRARCRRWKRR